MKQIFYIFAFLFITVTLILSEVIVMKNDDVINGKIIKMDEDTITVITKTKEIVIDKEDMIKIYYSEKEYEKDKKKSEERETIIDKDDNKPPYIVKVDPPNGAKNVIRSRYKVWEITFNEPMGNGYSIRFVYKPKKMPKVKWINEYTIQMEFMEDMKPSMEYKVILNDTQYKKYSFKDLKGNIVKYDTIVSFKTASEEMENNFLKLQEQAKKEMNINESMYAWLGVETEDLNNKIKKELNIKPIIRGVIIKEIMKDSPAEKDGLEKNDVIQSIFDEKIYTKEYFDFYINNLYLGSMIKLKIYRNGNIIEQEIILNIEQKK